jgi:hypothetical protein
MTMMNETSEKNYIRWLFLVFTLLVLCFPVVSDALSLGKYKPGFSIAQVVDDSDLVLLGRVIEVQFTGNFTTDITVKVDELIKGTPNAGANQVKFTIEGGVGTSPITGKKSILHIPGRPEFAAGEEVLFFFYKNRHPRLEGPHELRLFYVRYGKRVVKDGKVVLRYTLDNGREKSIKMPVDLAVQLGKAAHKDKDATRRLEDHIRASIQMQWEIRTAHKDKDTKSRLEDHIRTAIQMQLGSHGVLHLIRQDKRQGRAGIVLPENLVDRLKREAKQIIEQKKEDESR